VPATDIFQAGWQTFQRPDYIDAFFNVVNWDRVNGIYTAAK